MDLADNLKYIAELQKESGAEKKDISSWPYHELMILFNLSPLDAAIPGMIFKSVLLGFGIIIWFTASSAIEEYGGDTMYEYTMLAIATLILASLVYWLNRSVKKWQQHDETYRRLLQKQIRYILERESDESESYGQSLDEAYEKGYYAGAMDAKSESLDTSIFPGGIR